MIILKKTKKQIKLYNISNNKQEIQNTKFQGFFTLQRIENKLEINEIQLNKKDTQIITTSDELIKILKKQNIIITNNNKILMEFLNQEGIKYDEKKICDSCVNHNQIKFLNDKKAYTYKDNTYCKICSEQLIKNLLISKGKLNKHNKYFDIPLNKYNQIEKIIDILKKNKNPLNNPELTLYDILPATEKEYDKTEINQLNIPDSFKKILNKRIDTLLPVQELAIENGLLDNENLLIVSQTASGKTLIGELAGIPKAIKHKKMIYLSPLVALANQKYRDFKRDYEDLGLKVVIKVGHNRVKAEDELYIIDKPVDDADIIVATYEGLDFILRSGKYKNLKDVGTVIIDEIHTLENEERGHRLNGLVNRLLTIFPQSQIIGLSATIKNPKVIANEFNLKCVEYNKRPVKLERHLINTSSQKEKDDIISKICIQEFDNISSKGYHGQTIIFTDSRRKTQQVSRRLNKEGITSDYYHAGLTYSKKLEIEESFINQETSTIVTTAALANGIDFPASTVIFDSLRMGIEFLTNNEFHQMLGRASRPSYHDTGRVYLIVYEKESVRYNNEYYIALDLLKSDVDNINVLYDASDVYEQVLSDISAIENVDIDVLKNRYDDMWIPITFEEAISTLLDKNMIDYDSFNDTYTVTDYGRSVSKSFLNIDEAEYIRMNLYNNILDIVTDIELIRNAYFSSKC